jgi:hypothetical protein
MSEGGATTVEPLPGRCRTLFMMLIVFHTPALESLVQCAAAFSIDSALLRRPTPTGASAVRTLFIEPDQLDLDSLASNINTNFSEGTDPKKAMGDNIHTIWGRALLLNLCLPMNFSD